MQDTSQALLITLDEAARQLSISKSQINRLIVREGLPTIHLGRSVRIDPEALRAWVKERAKNQQQ